MAASFPSGKDFVQRAQHGEINEVVPSAMRLQEFSAGERSAISVALEHPGWSVLLDDRRPFSLAVNLGLPALSTPLFVVTLLEEGRLNADQALALLARLAALRTVSPHLLADALAALHAFVGRQEGDRHAGQ